MKFRKVGKFGIYLAAFVIVLSLAAYCALSSNVVVQRMILPRIAAALDLDIQIAGIELKPFRGAELRGVSISSESKPLLTSDLVVVSYDPWSLLQRTVLINSLRFESGELNLERDKDGWSFAKKNTSDSGETTSSSPWKVRIDQLEIKDLNLSLADTTSADGVQLSITALNVTGSEIGENLNTSLSATANAFRSRRGESALETQNLVVDLKVPFGSNWTPTEVAATLSAKDAALTVNDKLLESPSVVVSSAVESKMDSLVVKSLAMKATGGERALIDVTGSGQVDSAKGLGTLMVQVATLDSAILAPFIETHSELPHFVASGKTQATVSTKEVAFKSFELDLVDDNKESLLASSFNGSFLPPSRRLQGALQIARVTDSILKPFIATKQSPTGVLSGAVNLDLNLQTPGGSVDGAVSLKDLRLLPRTEKINGELMITLSGDATNLSIKNLALELSDEKNKEILKGKTSGSVQFETLTKVSLNLDIEKLDLDLLDSALREPPLETELVEDSASSNEVKALSYELDMNLTIESLVYAARAITDIQGKILLADSKLRVDVPKLSIDGNAGSIATNLDFALRPIPFDLDAMFDSLPVSAIQRVMQPEVNALVGGELKSFHLVFSGAGFDAEALNRSGDGNLTAKLEGLVLPTELRDVPPFNILFIPFVVTGKLTSILPTAIIPGPVKALSSGVANALESSQQITINDGKVALSIKEGKVDISDFVVGATLLPRVYFSGQVGLDGSLQLLSGIELLGIRAPLPITGSVSAPYPDVRRFAGELVKALGYNILNLPGNVIKQLDPRELLSVPRQKPNPELSAPD